MPKDTQQAIEDEMQIILLNLVENSRIIQQGDRAREKNKILRARLNKLVQEYVKLLPKFDWQNQYRPLSVSPKKSFPSLQALQARTTNSS